MNPEISRSMSARRLAPSRWWPVLAVLAMLLCRSAIAQDDPKSTGDALPRHALPGTPMTIDVPPGFQPSSSFLGLLDAATQSSIVVLELPAEAAKTVKDTDWRKDFEQRGVQVLGLEEQSTEDGFGVLIRVSQPATPQQGESECWFRIFGGETSMWMLVAKTPKEGAAPRMSVLRAAVMSARLDGSKSDDPFDGLPFRLKGLGGLEVLSRLPFGLVLTSDGEPDRTGAGKAVFFVTPLGEAFPRDFVNMAMTVELRARMTAQVADIEKVTVTEIEVDGLQGAEALVVGAHATSGTPMTTAFTLLFDGATAWHLQGSVATAEAEAWLPTFREITSGFTRQRRSFRSPGEAYELSVPGGWDRLASADPDVEMQLGYGWGACFVACFTDPTNAPADTPIAEYGRIVRDYYAGASEEESVGVTVKSTSEKTLGGRPALEYVLHRQADALAQVVTVIDGGDTYYRLVGWAPDWAYERHPSCLHEVIDTFELVKPPSESK